ncbi:acyl carrier protein [Sungkyunkwania multivorans]|uniref:Acyl carrier protein n=1 Tax=Sungkyunkwania multivorans TaxID=1173618 RepID=A0ABW3CZI3_9FLAO
MTKEEIYAKLENIIKIYLPEGVTTADIRPESDLTKELNINSANLVDIVLDVEDAFDIEIDDASIEEMTTVDGAIRVIDQRLEN